MIAMQVRNKNGVLFEAQRDIEWELEENRILKKWAKTKLVLLQTYTIYKWVGSPSYMTPKIEGLSKKQAIAKLQELEKGFDDLD